MGLPASFSTGPTTVSSTPVAAPSTTRLLAFQDRMEDTTAIGRASRGAPRTTAQTPVPPATAKATPVPQDDAKAEAPLRPEPFRRLLPPTTAPAPKYAHGQCGGSLPPCYVMRRESGGDPRVWNGVCYAPYDWKYNSPCGSSSASGKWQIVRPTWDWFGGYRNAADAPESVQDAKARQLWAGGRGCSHWSAC